jgi:hypothetical protein
MAVPTATRWRVQVFADKRPQRSHHRHAFQQRPGLKLFSVLSLEGRGATYDHPYDDAGAFDRMRILRV